MVAVGDAEEVVGEDVLGHQDARRVRRASIAACRRAAAPSLLPMAMADLLLYLRTCVNLYLLVKLPMFVSKGSARLGLYSSGWHGIH